ncbi:MAG: hypothetical protein KJO08_00755, partial [Gammaproteobacteria bacterium]|nr:hypothetical protein [Gammaproteobacteria bacterium]
MDSTRFNLQATIARSKRAGIYLHIPYCRQLCYYCDFHFSLSPQDKDELITAMTREIALRKDYLNRQATDVRTIYFGGGT